MNVSDKTQRRIKLLQDLIDNVVDYSNKPFHDMCDEVSDSRTPTTQGVLAKSFEELLTLLSDDIEQLEHKSDKLEKLKSDHERTQRLEQHSRRLRLVNHDMLKYLCQLCPQGWRLEFDFTVIGAETEDRPLGFRLVCHNGTDDNLTVEHEDFNVAVLDMMRLFMTGSVYPLT